MHLNSFSNMNSTANLLFSKGWSLHYYSNDIFVYTIFQRGRSNVRREVCSALSTSSLLTVVVCAIINYFTVYYMICTVRCSAMAVRAILLERS